MVMGLVMGRVRGTRQQVGRGLGGAVAQVGRLGFTEACGARVAGVTGDD